MLEHISFRHLTDYADNRLQDPHLSQQINDHLEKCDICRQALSIVLRIGQTAAQLESPQPAQNLIERVLKATRRTQTLQFRQQSLAHSPPTVLHDSRIAALAAGVRGGSKDCEMLFTFDRFDLHLSIIHSAELDSFTLRGQLMVSEPAEEELEGNQIDLLMEQAQIRTVLTDQLGCFRISNLKSGEYGLRVITDIVESVIDHIIIQN